MWLEGVGEVIIPRYIIELGAERQLLSKPRAAGSTHYWQCWLVLFTGVIVLAGSLHAGPCQRATDRLADYDLIIS